ncbi:redox-sensing transcriptional repressor Rex [bacterium]|nr:redox-sensing transcriptional repressor Rex [bacterium]
MAAPKKLPSSKEAGTGDSSSSERKIPKAVIKRLSLYSRALQTLERDKVEKVSSTELGEMLGLNSAQVRKDLAYFGQFGVPGFGYPVGELREKIKAILGTNREIRVALIGVGHLGTALMAYGGFGRQGFLITCAFDVAPEKLSGESRVPVHSTDELEQRLDEYEIDLVILTVPAESAQGLTNRIVNAGIKAILNFVPMRLQVPDYVKVHYVDLAIEIESLSYYLK